MKHVRYDPERPDIVSYVRVVRPDEIPPEEPRTIDVVILDMNHSWPNVGHDSLVHIVRGIAGAMLDFLSAANLRIRVLSFDVRQRLMVPRKDHFRLFIGTGGPGHLDPRVNDGTREQAQGIVEDPSWEPRLFALFDQIAADPASSLVAVCHTFGVICRWSGVADAVARGPEKGGKSTGVPTNWLTDKATEHPWFSKFSALLPDGRSFRVVDNRLFDLIPRSSELPNGMSSISFEKDGSRGDALTAIEIARDAEGVMPRFFAVNHHPEIIDREHLLRVLDAKLRRVEVTAEWYDERANTIAGLMVGEAEFQSRLTSRYMLIDPIRFHLTRLVRQRAEELGVRHAPHEEQLFALPAVSS
ncbi:MAG TPA: hypothetical protein VNM92_10690 [Thermoanaerobaculia bacterium]|nr:hypothetical protein [Thermoanaerobaculia bacterium]